MPALLATQGTNASDACTPLLTFAALIVSTIREKAENERKTEAAKSYPNEDFDIIIVGGGGAGCVLAARLSEVFQWRILLLERGGSEPSETYVPGFADINLGSEQIAENIQGEKDPRSCNGTGCVVQNGRVLGGGTALNEMMFVRGNKEDYNSWAKYTGDDSWSYEQVLPYFKRLEDNLDPAIAADKQYHGTRGPLPVARLPHRPRLDESILKGLGDIGLKAMDINAENQFGYMVSQAQSRLGERWSTSRAYLLPAVGRSNLEVRTFAEVTRVLINDSLPTPRAEGVEYRDAGGGVRVARARLEVVLAAGALHTPRLLMLSGVGPAQHLQDAGIKVVADLPVGENLQDHVYANGIELDCTNCSLSDISWEQRLEDIRRYNSAGPPCRSREGPLASRGMASVVAFIDTSGSDTSPSVPDIQMLFLGIAQQPDGTRCLPMDLWRSNMLVLCPAVLHPQSRGSVRLNISDPQADAIVTFNYLTEEEDVRTLVRGMKETLRLGEAMERHGQFKLSRTPMSGCEGFTFGTDEYYECLGRTYSHTVWHFSGTTRMGNDTDTTAVLDSKLRVRGVDALRVVDTSIMPSLTSGNTMAPVIMIAEKASDLIKSGHMTS